MRLPGAALATLLVVLTVPAAFARRDWLAVAVFGLGGAAVALMLLLAAPSLVVRLDGSTLTVAQRPALVVGSRVDVTRFARARLVRLSRWRLRDRANLFVTRRRVFRFWRTRGVELLGAQGLTWVVGTDRPEALLAALRRAHPALRVESGPSDADARG